MKYSRTPYAYDRLIRGDADVIFVLQPSDGQLETVKNAGREFSLTPIAKEAFVFFVNTHNPVSDLSIEQIQDIYAVTAGTSNPHVRELMTGCCRLRVRS